ncbi:MAG: hypothetical protein U0L66_05490 [Acutalibacteraceae bacterium]|nr:hypothetical protein [Acutalibacteraceae bacterium]
MNNTRYKRIRGGISTDKAILSLILSSFVLNCKNKTLPTSAKADRIKTAPDIHKKIIYYRSGKYND